MIELSVSLAAGAIAAAGSAAGFRGGASEQAEKRPVHARQQHALANVRRFRLTGCA